MIKSELEKMFAIVGLSQDKLHSALIEMGSTFVKPEYRSKWCKEKPTTGFCYVVSEVIFHFIAPKGTKSSSMDTPEGSHWFLKYPDGQIIDLTADQVEYDLNYEKAVEKKFITKKISKRGKQLAERLNLI